MGLKGECVAQEDCGRPGDVASIAQAIRSGAGVVLSVMFGDYYKHAFPYDVVHRLFARGWQPGGPSSDKREYGIETHPDGQYRRWKACPRAQDLQTFVQHPQFGKLNVGATFDKCPLERWSCPSGSEPKPVQAELRIDIDMDDYDKLGISKDNIDDCDAAFAVVGVGLEVCIAVLRENFGFEHILPVYSGRRGGHLWVCDKRACMLEDGARKSIVDFLKPGQRAHSSGRKTFKWLLEYPTFGSPNNPMKKGSIFSRIVYKFFRSIGVKPKQQGGLGLLDIGFDRADFLKMIDDRMATDLEQEVRSAANGLAALVVIEQSLRQKSKDVKVWLLPRFCEAICTLVWPRVDEAVSTHMNHTLKAPFSVHPKTGRVSVPILGRRNLWDFAPSIDAPMASAEMPVSFANTIQMTVAFIDTLSQSPTELWEPPDLATFEPLPKKRCFRLTTGVASEDATSVLSDTTRVAWSVNRAVSVYVDDEGIAHFEMSTRSFELRPSIVIKPAQFPTFGRASVCESIVEQTLAAITASSNNVNTAYHAYSWPQIVIVDPDVDDEAASLKRANARYERLRVRLAEGASIGQARVGLGEMALSSYIRQELWPLAEQLRSL